MTRRPAIIAHPGFADAAIAYGRALLPHASTVAVAVPGAFVFDGYDHVLRDGTFVPTYAAWGRDTVPEPMVALDETPRFASVPGIDDALPAAWSPLSRVAD